ncbi:MAG: tetratricopeptide repeat protein [Candidatus Delongbacteria bacterium]|nr:tetratricopeptide repeat protein [Candidatus Delongbacteria bacterium]MBN2833890.1 tetratricopeptide repeat protein [Candidatus Delongbacteria bacterium]
MVKKEKQKRYTEVSLVTFLKDFLDKSDQKTRYCFILGAGASIQSGISSGQTLARNWLNEIKNKYSDEYQVWVKENKIDENHPGNNYSKIYEKNFEIDPQKGFNALETEMDNKEPSCGYAVLANILSEGKHNIVVTTNFDSLTEDALFIYTNKKPLVCGHESLAEFISVDLIRPIIIKIHRSLLFSPKNKTEEISKLENKWEKGLTEIFNYYTPIFIGYGGNDGSLMNFLMKAEKLGKSRFIWCYWDKDESFPSKSIEDLLIKHNGIAIPIIGFDEMMIKIQDMKGYGTFDVHIIETAERRKKNYIDQIVKVNKSNEETSKSLNKITSSGTERNNYLKFLLMVDNEKDINKKREMFEANSLHFKNNTNFLVEYAILLDDLNYNLDLSKKMFKEAMNLDPNDYTIVLNYAITLSKSNEIEQANEQFQKAYSLSSDDPNVLANYAIFLFDKKKNYDKAEELLLRALGIDNKSCKTNGIYAHFLHNYKNDYDNAEVYYLKSLEIDPTYDVSVANYAVFLESVRKDISKAEIFYRKAVNLKENETNYIYNLARFLATNKISLQESDNLFKKLIATNPSNPDFYSDYAILLHLELKKYDLAGSMYKKAIDLVPDKIEYLMNYANFLDSARKNYKEAAKHYEKAIELGSSDPICLGNYAHTLLILGRKNEAEKFIYDAFDKNPLEISILSELWFYRFAHFYDEWKEIAKEELDKLISNGPTSPGWNLSEDLIIAAKSKHPEYDLVKDYAKRISEEK